MLGDQPLLVFDRSKLSAREDQILELAIGGLTDQQIGKELSISTSTVVSYWVRMRGKLGPLSRTEFVAYALQQRALVEIGRLQVRVSELESNLAAEERRNKDSILGETYRAVLDSMAEGVLAADETGSIMYANRRVEALFGYESGELVGRAVESLIPPRFRHVHAMHVADYAFQPRPMRIGLTSVVFGLRKDGTEIRLILLIDAIPSDTGLVVSCVVRSFMEEVDTLRRRASAALQDATP